jgi:hypothetical protein
MKPFELKHHLEKIGIDHIDVRRICWYVIHEDEPYYYHWFEINDSFPRRVDYYYDYCVELYDPINNCHFVQVKEVKWKKPQVLYFENEPPKPVKKQLPIRRRETREPRIKKKRLRRGFGKKNLHEDCGA